jgi:hypothetical protein
MHFVMGRVPEGHRPTLDEAMERLAHKQTHGDSDYAFGWDYLKATEVYTAHQCGSAA